MKFISHRPICWLANGVFLCVKLPCLYLFILALLLTGCASVNPVTGVPDKAYRGVVYERPRQGERYAVDIYVPQRKDPATGKPVALAEPPPLIVWYHGGGWRYGHRRLFFMTRPLTEQGFAVATVSYRLSWRDKWPKQATDVHTSLDFLRARGREFGYDATRLGVAGSSAGGHLAAYAGLTEGKPKIDAVVALYPPTDLVILGEPHVKKGDHNLLSDLFGGKMGEPFVQKLAYEASPVNYVTPNGPPFLLVHGSDDPTVPLEQSQMLNRKLFAAGVESRLIIVPGAKHGFSLDEEQLQQVSDFFKKHLMPEKAKR